MSTYMGISSELNENLVRNMCCHMLCGLLGKSKISCINMLYFWLSSMWAEAGHDMESRKNRIWTRIHLSL